MKRTTQFLGLILLVALFIPGCSDDDDGGTGPVATGDFSGSWEIVGQVSQKMAKTCESDIGDTFTDTVVITQEGTIAVIQVDLGTNIELTVSGNRASGSVTTSEGDYSETSTVVLNLENGGTFLSGTVTEEIQEGTFSCTEVADLLGVKEGTETSGAFNGFWELSATIIEDTCEIGELTPGCQQMVQYDEVILMISGDSVLLGTVSGNTAIFPILTESDFMNTSGTITLVLAPGGNNMAGSQLMTFSNPQNPQESCMVNLAITGNRTTNCSKASTFGGFQLLR